MTFLLLSPDHFAVSPDRIGHVNSKVLFAAYAIAFFFTPAAGYIFDLFGRRGPILFSIFANIALLFAMPYTAPSIALFVLARTGVSCFNTVLESSPLAADYIKSDSRGTAVALGTIGMLLGEAFGMAILLGLSINMDLNDAYAFAAVILFVMTVIASFTLREPKIRTHAKVDRETINFERTEDVASEVATEQQ